MVMNTRFIDFMTPNLGEVEGHIGLNLSVRLSVRPSATLFDSRETQEPLMLQGSLNTLWHVHEKISGPVFFIFSAGHVIQELCPFFDFI